jgi:apolipoprotein D and lipocalin family protein
MKPIFSFFCILFSLVQVSAQPRTDQSVHVVPSVDLSRYTGTWYEIARLPNRFQNDCVGDVTATYTLLENGEIRVVNRCGKENGEVTQVEGRARQANENGPNSKLEVRFAPAFLSFLPFVWGDYWIIDLAPDYSYAVIGGPSREYLWILARSLKMDDETLKGILDHVHQQGYQTDALIRTRHTQ